MFFYFQESHYYFHPINWLKVKFICLSPKSSKTQTLPATLIQNAVLHLTSGIALFVPKIHYYEQVF